MTSTRNVTQLLMGLVALDINTPTSAPSQAPPPPPAVVAPAPPPAAPPDGKHEHGLRVSFGSDDDDDAADAADRVHQLGLSPEIVEKLSSDRIQELLRRPHDSPTTEVLVPGFFFACILGIVLASLLIGFRKERQRHETLRLMIERGANLPPELLTPPRVQRSDLRRGILWTSIGLGLTLLITSQEPSAWGVGMLPTLLGCGYLIAWKLEKKPSA